MGVLLSALVGLELVLGVAVVSVGYLVVAELATAAEVGAELLVLDTSVTLELGSTA
ncbi:hypothetical protein LPL03_02150 [Lactiplantibacillus argentoratensis]|nr:hypothetical protein LPL03_02150 [Lactiplantibacillus argentoratensis]